MSEVAVPDRIRAMLLERAESCLAHVRAVKWGEATASYTVEDGGFALEVLVRVACVRKVEPK